jgi:3D (Asp-Asp-Asp) domain-containing protein
MRNKEGPLLKRTLAALACLALVVPGAGAKAETTDPIGDVIAKIASHVEPILETFGLKATLYHGGVRGIGAHDALGCTVVPMRTAAVDGVTVHKGDLIYIKETVGLPMPDGRTHDGYWYASDSGGAIRKGRIDLFTGQGARSMNPLMALNLATLTVARVGAFAGCPKA